MARTQANISGTLCGSQVRTIRSLRRTVLPLVVEGCFENKYVIKKRLYFCDFLFAASTKALTV